ncbi:MASE1 domain-containing protein [Spirulina subsalsa FACHB-351]|uniref:histidine kinase n=1 Tax=Spirulina subsalsa FACHB-351 TaxID=234711 RepID=A0ABT3LA25_9CYAN|nr:MASE1 domain-containing protein [Spirulina subsalsa]MCW6037825.1 MASE1 domain-containing protein [Spirulina subsalsa FACHB-351]
MKGIVTRWCREDFSAIALIAVSYCGLGLLGLHLATLPGEVTPIWVPAGIGLAAVLLGGAKIWPAIALGSFGISVLFNPTPISLAIGALTSIGNTLTPLCGATLIYRFTGTRYPFQKASEVFKFAALGAVFSQGISATIGVSALCLGGWVPWSLFPPLWVTWWISNVTGVLIVTPLILTWATPGGKKNPHPLLLRLRRLLPELCGWLLLFSSVVVLAFWRAYPVEYLMLPLTVWAAFRFPKRITTMAIALTTAMAITGTLLEKSSFLRPNLTESLLLLESFISVIAVTTLVLMAVIEERRYAILALQQANEHLESRVLERTRELSQANEELQRKELNLQEKAQSLTLTLQELRQTQAQLIQNEKMTSLGHLVAGIAHEINNPISFIYSNLTPATEYATDLLDLLALYETIVVEPPPEIEDLAEEMDLEFIKDDFFKLLDSMKSGADRIHQIVLSLRNFSRLDEAEIKSVNIHHGIESTLLILQHRLAGFYSDELERNSPPIRIIKDYGDLPEIQCLAGEMNQVFMTLLMNAIDAIQEVETQQEGIIKISTGLLGDETVEISISDNGLGMPLEVQRKVFDPFFTTKPVGKSVGLGLYMSYETIVQKHKGQLICCSEQGVGTTFKMILPLRQN